MPRLPKLAVALVLLPGISLAQPIDQIPTAALIR